MKWRTTRGTEPLNGKTEYAPGGNSGDFLFLEDNMAYETELKRYDNLYDEYRKKNEEDTAKKKQQTTEDYNSKLKEAYISRMQNEKNLNENLKKSGIRGGATETSHLKLATNYENNRNDMNKEKSRALQDIDAQAADNLFNYKQTTDQAKINYTEQREAEERQLAQNQQAENKAAALDLLQAKYGAYYDTSSLRKAYNSAKTDQERAIIQARINYLTTYAKGY